MVRISLIFSILLILIGLVGYFISGMASITALIPAFLGILLLILALIGRKESARKHAMHIASGLMFLGFAGTVSGLIKFFGMLGGTEVIRPQAVTIQAIMAIICLVFVILSIKSFVDARRKKND